jgi:hypothetical protein
MNRVSPRDRRAAPRPSPETAAAIERFLSSTRDPALIEPGEEPFALAPDSYELDCSNGRLILAAWDARRNISRKITAIASERPGRLELSIEKLGGRAGTILLVDRAKPRNQALQKHGSRLVYRESFRQSLARQFPGWTIARLSAEADLEHSLSPAYPRAMLRRGTSALAAIGASALGGDPDGALTYGLIWLDYLRRNESRLGFEGLMLFRPEGGTQTTCLRLRHLQAGRYEVYVQALDGYEDRLDPADYGNLDTQLDHCRASLPDHALDPAWLDRIRANPEVESIDQRGDISYRVRGLEFARATDRGLVFGIETKQLASASNIVEVEAIARLLARLRSPGAADRRGALYLRNPEAWLESQVRQNLESVDATFWPAPVYGQVPALTGCERGIIDLLALGRDGRLAVIELKASEDPHLPLQALDYWMRVEWHARANEFSKLGYFPGKAIVPAAPRLVLLAPALSFHSTTETVIRFLSPSIEVERIGVGLEWHKKLQVVFRARGAEPPGLSAQDHHGEAYPSTGKSGSSEPQSE